MAEFSNLLGYDVKDAKARMLTDHIVTPQMFGAIGDGETDDTTAIQRALNAIADGGTLYIPEGVYLISAPLEYYSNQKIVGAGATLQNTTIDGDYILRPANRTVGGYDGVENVLIEGITFDANALTVTCIVMGHGTKITVKDCIFRNIGYWHFIEVNSSQYCAIDNCLFMDFKHEREIIAGYGGEMIQFDSANSAGGAPDLTPHDNTVSQYIVITNCTFDNTENYDTSIDPYMQTCGIGNHFMHPARDVIISNCHFKNMGCGVRLRCVTGLLCENLNMQNVGVAFAFNTQATMTGTDYVRYFNIKNCNVFCHNTFKVGFVVFDSGLDAPPTRSQYGSITGNFVGGAYVADSNPSSISAPNKECLGATIYINGNVFEWAFPVIDSGAYMHNNYVNRVYYANGMTNE